MSDVCRVIELLDRLQRSGELPPPKLQALQRVLQSKFCSAIREVRRQELLHLFSTFSLFLKIQLLLSGVNTVHAVPQVYEQLYDTLDIVGGPEVRAQATAKVRHAH